MKTICGIYKITSPENSIYIGQSINIIKREKYYAQKRCKRQRKIYLSILKHGWDNHKFEILEECDKKDLNNKERYYIDLFKTFNSEKGLNIRNGGGRGELSEETKERIREKTIGELNPFFGKKHSEETLNKMRQSASLRKANKAPNFGKKKSDEAKNKIKLKIKNLHNSGFYIGRGFYKNERITRAECTNLL